VADERASITLSLTDEMSDKLQDINNALDGLTRRFGAIRDQSSSAFQQFQRGLERSLDA